MVILTKLNKTDFENILSEYDIGKYTYHKHIWYALDNTAYSLKTTKGKFLLKIIEKDKLGAIKYRIKVMEFVQERNIPIPNIIKTKKSKSLFIYRNKRILIQEFIKGKELNKYNDKLIKNIAKNLGLLGNSLLKFKLYGKFTWHDPEFKGLVWKVKKIGNFDIEKHETLLLKEIKKIKKGRLRKSVIHADTGGSNFLIENNKLVAIIDWDDVHEDFLVYEIAVFISNTFVSSKEIDKNGVKLFLKEYQKYIKLNEEEKKALYYFIKLRRLNAVSWLAMQQKTHKDKSKKIGKYIHKLLEGCLNFDKVPLEEFLSWT